MFTRKYLLFALLCLTTLAACQPQSPAVDVDPEAIKVCESAGGTFERALTLEGSVVESCVFPDGSSCEAAQVLSGNCPAANLAIQGNNFTPTPFPTKIIMIPETPITKGPDPFVGMATFTSTAHDFAFRYPDTFLVEELPNEVRLTRPGQLLLVQVRGLDENVPFTQDIPYEASGMSGDTVEFFGQPVEEQGYLLNGELAAVSYGTPDQPLTGGGNAYLVQLVSLRSDVQLSGQELAEIHEMLRSFEVWTNH